MDTEGSKKNLSTQLQSTASRTSAKEAVNLASTAMKPAGKYVNQPKTAATKAEILRNEPKSKNIDIVAEPATSRLPLPSDPNFFRRLADNGSDVSRGDSQWHMDARRTVRISSPESGFTITPVDGPSLNEHSLGCQFPIANGNGIKKADNFRPVTLLPQLPQCFTLSNLTTPLESQVIRELLTVVLGFDGSFVHLTADGCAVASNVDLRSYDSDAILQIAYTGFLCRSLQTFCQVRQAELTSGICSHKIADIVQEELNDYRRRIAMLDAKFHRDNHECNERKNQSAKIGHLTLMNLLLPLTEECRRLHILLNLAHATTGLRGGNLLSFLNEQYRRGDVLVRSIVSRMIQASVEPILNQLRRWIFYGVLDDPFHEFFITDSPTAPFDLYWSTRFQIRPEMVPYFLSQDVAQTMLMGGKSVAFSKHMCSMRHAVLGMEKYKHLQRCEYDGPDPVWDVHTNQIQKDVMKQLHAACHLSSVNVVNILREEYNIGSHFEACRKFLFLELGDFTLYLMDNLMEYLNQPAQELFLRSLSSIINDVVKSTSAQFEPPEVIACLHTEIAVVGEELGWDAFLLAYRIKGPLKSVFDESALQKYRRIFSFLWRIKRAEFLLNGLWKDDVLSRLTTMEQIDFVELLHQTRLLASRMTHFVMQYQTFFNAHVLGVIWRQFLDRLARVKSLDDMLSAHQDYLVDVEEKCFIRSKSIKNIHEQESHLRAILDNIIKFAKFYEDLLRYALAPMAEDEKIYRENLGRLSSRLDTINAIFRNEVCRFIVLLDTADMESLTDLRSLLDQNNFFKETAKKHRNQDTLSVAGLG